MYGTYRFKIPSGPSSLGTCIYIPPISDDAPCTDSFVPLVTPPPSVLLSYRSKNLTMTHHFIAIYIFIYLTKFLQHNSNILTVNYTANSIVHLEVACIPQADLIFSGAVNWMTASVCECYYNALLFCCCHVQNYIFIWGQTES